MNEFVPGIVPGQSEFYHVAADGGDALVAGAGPTHIDHPRVC